MVIYVCKTVKGLWAKADPNDPVSESAMKIWYGAEADSRQDYKDRSLTVDNYHPVYSIFSLGKGEQAIKKFQVLMARKGVEVKEIDPNILHALLKSEIEANGE